MSQTTIDRHAAPGYHPMQAMSAALWRVLRSFYAWNSRRQGNAQLMMLDDRELKDIGISRAQAQFQHDRPFWRV